MKTRVSNEDENFKALLVDALQQDNDPLSPMNSSYTKLAAIFGYHNPSNTIWDSRVSSALCYRLALIAKNSGIIPDVLQKCFPGIGYVPGRSKRFKGRENYLNRYWKNVYQQWSGHRAGAILLAEIAEYLNKRHIACPITIFPDVDGNKWNSWKVNMLFFIDDIGFDAKNEDKKKETKMNGKQKQKKNKKFGDFEFVRGKNFLHKDLIIPANKTVHKNNILGTYRILFEPYILPDSKNAKVSLRCRTADPAFNEILNLAKKIEGCPVVERKKNGETASIWIYRMGPANGRTLQEISHKFIAEEHKWFTDFIQPLKEILEKYPAK